MSGSGAARERPAPSDRKVAANRANSKKSTGPRTVGGKAVSRLNAVRHGLTADLPLLPGEDAGDRLRLSEGLHAALHPVDDFERELVERIAAAAWRLRRVERVETALYALRMLEDCAEDARRESFGSKIPRDPMAIVQPTPEEQAYAIGAEIVRVKAGEAIEEPEVSIARAFVRDIQAGDGFGRLSRYESSLIRNLQRYIAELRTLQASRKDVVPIDNT